MKPKNIWNRWASLWKSKMANYGIPYMGSKDKLCDWLVTLFPPATHFYDIFGGGFSVTHAVLQRRFKDYQYFHFNEIRPGICELIQNAIKGHYSYKNFRPPWISRKDFAASKDTDPYIKMCWSFGNNGNNYLYSKEIEFYKRSMHQAIIFNEFDDLASEVLGISRFAEGYSIIQKRLFLRNKIEFYRQRNQFPKLLKPYVKLVSKQKTIKGRDTQPKQLQQLEQLERLQQLERLERLERLEQLERLERLIFTSLSYEKIKIKSNSILYCDPPYAETANYDNAFDTKAFLNWAHAQTNPVFISEYEIKDQRFRLLASKNKCSMFSSFGRTNKSERIYLNQAAIDLINSAGKNLREKMLY